MKRSGHITGFTLIEVLVALVIVAFGIGALLTTLTSAADNVAYLREKSFAEWIALNRLSETRLAAAQAKVGSSEGEVEFAGARWRWQQEIVDQGQAGMRRIDVSVSRLPDEPVPARELPALATAFGFLGTSVAKSTGDYPDWSADPQGGGVPP